MMNEDFIKRLDFDSETFQQMKTDMNFILQRMLGSMVEKGSTEGSMTVKIDINMVTEWIPNTDPDIKEETRMIRKPQFKHKCTSAIKISDEKAGTLNNEMELDMDENGCYYLKPVADTTQRTIFDKDFQSGLNKPEEGEIIDADEESIRGIPGGNVPLLPGGDSEQNTDDVIDAEFKECKEDTQDTSGDAQESPDSVENGSGYISTEESENDAEIDATEALFGHSSGDIEDSEQNGPEDDGYRYDEPEEE